MENYRKNKERIKINEYGSLYFNRSKVINERPLIYIGGQMEHRFHVFEQTGFTGDPGHNMFDGSWFYDYPIHTREKSRYNAINFGENLLAALKKVGVEEVDLITESYGGLIGTYVTNSPLIHKVVEIHPPILGTPLANRELIEFACKELELEQRVIARIIKFIVNNKYGFEQENAGGLYNSALQEAADISKILVVGSSINYETEQNDLVKKLYKLIYTLTKKENDGVVIFDKKDLEKLHISYIEENEKLNHFDAGSKENIESVYQKTLRR